MENLKKLGLPDTFCFAPYTNLDLDQDGTWYPCYRSKQPQGSWKEYDVTDTSTVKLRMGYSSANNITLYGTGQSVTSMSFLRLGDT